MKRWITLLTSIMTYAALPAQENKEIKNDSCVFEYRFKLATGFDKSAQSNLDGELTDLFKTKPVFYQEVAQYSFSSNIEISQFELEKLMKKYNMMIEFYQKVSLTQK